LHVRANIHLWPFCPIRRGGVCCHLLPSMLLPGARLDGALDRPLRRGPELHLHSCTTVQFAQSPGPQLPKLSDCLLANFIKVIAASWSQTQSPCMLPIVARKCVCALRSIIGKQPQPQGFRCQIRPVLQHKCVCTFK
jgi:hypothetical protein